jgi:hypothetical protein
VKFKYNFGIFLPSQYIDQCLRAPIPNTGAQNIEYLDRISAEMCSTEPVRTNASLFFPWKELQKFVKIYYVEYFKQPDHIIWFEHAERTLGLDPDGILQYKRVAYDSGDKEFFLERDIIYNAWEAHLLGVLREAKKAMGKVTELAESGMDPALVEMIDL